MAQTSQQFPGARFYKADLHVHTPASRCWRDNSRSLEQLFEKLKSEAIELVAITDHNTVASVKAASKLGRKHGICVFPGIEVGTKEGHVLAIFDPKKPIADLEDWLALIGIGTNKRGDPKAMATAQDGRPLSIVEVFKLIEQAGGAAIAPHPNSKGTGFLAVLRQKGMARQEAYRSPDLRGLEVGKEDPKKILEFAAGKVSGYRKKYACIASSDAHRIDEIGSHFTYIKLGHFGIGALKQVLYDPGMRIRFPDRWPPGRHAWIQSLTVSQGFFENVEFYFHPDTNCLIGGKAVGKSLAIDLIRFALDIKSPVKTINEEVSSRTRSSVCLGDGGTVVLRVLGKDGEQYRIERYVSDLDKGPQIYYGDSQTKAAESVYEVFRCSIYSQNEIIELGRQLPALLDWLDRFIDLSHERAEARRLEGRMRSVLSLLDKKHGVAATQDFLRQRKKDLEAKKQLLEEKVKEKILKSFPKWQKEKRELGELRGALVRLLSDTVEPLEETSINDYLPKLDKATPGYATIDTEMRDLAKLDGDIQNAASALRQAVEKKQRGLEVFAENWQKAYNTAKSKHDKVIRSAGVRNASAITSELDKVIRAIEETEQGLVAARAAHRAETALQQELRGTLMPAFSDCYSEMYRRRSDKASEITNSLGGFVRIHVRQMAERADFEQAVISMARGSGLQKRTLQQIVHKMTPVEFAECLADRDATTLASESGLEVQQATGLVEHAWSSAQQEEGPVELSKLYEPIFVELQDKVLVELRGADGETYKPMEKLSVGSKCTAILSVALVEGDWPLIVDQPEDSLDSRFVFEEIVNNVRQSKQGRQFCFATHNANVAVASDADLIYCLEATATEGTIEKGSIDEVSTRDRVMLNLEGGGEAFRLRGQKYAIVVDDPNAVVLPISATQSGDLRHLPRGGAD